MFGLSISLKTSKLKTLYPYKSYWNAYGCIKRLLEGLGFKGQGNGIYVGGEKATADSCNKALKVLASRYRWFKPSVQSVKLMQFKDVTNAL